MPLRVVTGNEKKWREMQAIMRGHALERVDVDLPELQAASVADVARAKCAAAVRIAGAHGPLLVEDTGLCFAALGGRLPGPYIKWFLHDVRPEGLARMLDAYDDRAACAVCVIALWPGAPDGVFREEDVVVFEGVVAGRVASTPRWAADREPFGWDPVFEPDAQAWGTVGLDAGVPQTYGEMDADVKNTLSHRRRAFDLLLAHLRA
jgi:inosine triphosphate pyrophosphatase